jgi:hypothetical protein
VAARNQVESFGYCAVKKYNITKTAESVRDTRRLNIPSHAKAYRGKKGFLHSFFHPALHTGEWSNSRAGWFNPEENSPCNIDRR